MDDVPALEHRRLRSQRHSGCHVGDSLLDLTPRVAGRDRPRPLPVRAGPDRDQLPGRLLMNRTRALLLLAIAAGCYGTRPGGGTGAGGGAHAGATAGAQGNTGGETGTAGSSRAGGGGTIGSPGGTGGANGTGASSGTSGGGTGGGGVSG